MNTHHLSIGVQDLNVQNGAVHLSTVHKAKGMQWSHVFVCGVVNKIWGNEKEKNKIALPNEILKFTNDSDNKNEESARLFYVALTRASQQVYLSYPATTIDNNRTSFKEPSQFITILEQYPQLTQTHEFLETEATTIETITTLLQPVIVNSLQIKNSERQYLQKLVDNFTLSASALNDYLRDPAQFVSSYLLRAPRIGEENNHLIFGSAIHHVLQFMYTSFVKGQPLPSLNHLLQIFTNELKKNDFDLKKNYKRVEQGKQALTNYYEDPSNQNIKIYSLEKNFGVAYPITIDGVAIKGKIDRLDFVNNNEIALIDYKTGTPKIPSEINKLDKNASEREKALPENLRGSYKRQLLFYKLLTQYDPKFNHNVNFGVLDFLVGSSSRPASKRIIEFTSQDLELMKDLIKQVDGEIRSLKFID